MDIIDQIDSWPKVAAFAVGCLSFVIAVLVPFVLTLRFMAKSLESAVRTGLPIKKDQGQRIPPQGGSGTAPPKRTRRTPPFPNPPPIRRW